LVTRPKKHTRRSHLHTESSWQLLVAANALSIEADARDAGESFDFYPLSDLPWAYGLRKPRKT